MFKRDKEATLARSSQRVQKKNINYPPTFAGGRGRGRVLTEDPPHFTTSTMHREKNRRERESAGQEQQLWGGAATPKVESLSM